MRIAPTDRNSSSKLCVASNARATPLCNNTAPTGGRPGFPASARGRKPSAAMADDTRGPTRVMEMTDEARDSTTNKEARRAAARPANWSISRWARVMRDVSSFSHATSRSVERFATKIQFTTR